MVDKPVVLSPQCRELRVRLQYATVAPPPPPPPPSPPRPLSPIAPRTCAASTSDSVAAA